MPKEPPRTSDFPLPGDKVAEQIADAAALADRDYERFGWNEKEGEAKPKPKRAPRKKSVKKQ